MSLRTVLRQAVVLRKNGRSRLRFDGLTSSARISWRPLSSSTPPPPPTTTSPRQLNCAFALDKEHERFSFRELTECSTSALQGIGPVHQEQLQSLKLKTIQDLANYRFYHLAKAIHTLAQTEETGGRMEDAAMNLNKGLDKAYETKSFTDLLDAPVEALQGISEASGANLKALGAGTIGDLAMLKYCKWAEAIVTASKFEE